MEDKLIVSKTFKLFCFILIAIGVITFVVGFFTDAKQTWSNYLLNNYYFLSIAIGASFFYALQYITQSGWSSGFKRVPEAMGSYVLVSALFFIVLIFGIHTLYHWSHPEAVAHDEILQHKSPFLNAPFFSIRLIIYFSLWILMLFLLRKSSQNEDKTGGLASFEKSEHYSKIFIFILAITFSFSAFDWIMSIDAHWFSTLFAAKNFIAAFYHGAAIIALIVLVLHRNGKFPFLNIYHVRDFGTYIFMLSIIWGYLWFSQFMLIWYGNIPEETIYYVSRWEDEWKPLFFANIILNWLVPFVVLMPKFMRQNKKALLSVIVVLIIGQWIDLYLQIMPGTIHNNAFGFIEVGTFLGYLGLFSLITALSLSKSALVAKNHPYLEECIHHHIG